MIPDLFASTLSLTRQGIQKSLTQYMPPSAYRDFCLWMLEQNTPQREQWLELMGIPQMIRLFFFLMKDVARPQDWEHLIEGVVHVNLYQMYEVVSDNLAIGLARPAETDTHHTERGQVLQGFNEVMSQRLEGRALATSELLEPLRASAAHISSFEQSLRPDKHRAFAALYRSLHPEVSEAALEHSVWPCLVANIESCVALERLGAESPVAPLVRRGLVNRYRGVSALLAEPDMPFERRVRIGVDTILVSPMTAWYLGVLARLQEESGLEALMRNGLLEQVLDDASLLLRLLNDLGTNVVTQTDEERKQLFEPLRQAALQQPSETLASLLLRTSPHTPALNRVHKDVQHGEFNVCLHGLMDTPVSQSLEVFESRLTDAARMYQRQRQRWESNLGDVRRHLSRDGMVHLIHRFVVFHEKLYAHHYNGQQGEYAV